MPTETTRIYQLQTVRTLLADAISSVDYVWFNASTKVLDEPVNEHRPVGNYMTVSFLIYNAPVSDYADPGAQHDCPNDHVYSVIRVQAFGEEACNALSDAALYLRTRQALDVAEARGYQVYIEDARIFDVPMLLDTDHEIRGYLDIGLGCNRIGYRVITQVETVAVVDDGNTAAIEVDAAFDMTE